MTSPQLLHRVGARALDWLWDNRAGFRARPDADTPGLEIKGRFKPIGELGIIGQVLFREGVAGSRQATLARQLLDYAWTDLLEEGGLLAWMQRDEPLSPIPLELYVPFRELGYRHRGVEEYAKTSNGLAGWAASEMVPNRRLGLSRAEARVGLQPSMPVEEAFRRTWLGRTPEPWTAHFHAAYDVTHTVYHLTDWGQNPGALPADIVDYLRLWLPVWIDEWTQAEHWDLLGELLVVDACLPRPVLDPDAWTRYAAAQAEDGSMPIDRTPPQGDPGEGFDFLYHPTLVAAFASMMATSRAMSELAGVPS